MGILEELLAGLDSAKRTAGRNISDLYNDPAAYTERLTDRLRNANAGVAPVAAGGELTNRPLTQAERAEQAFGAMDFGGGLGVIKPKGGNWLEKDIKHAVGGVMAGPGTAGRQMMGRDPDVNEDIANEWAKKNLGSYVKNLMGTPEDPLRRLADEGITHIDPKREKLGRLDTPVTKLREQAGFPPRGMAKTAEGREWEKRSDSIIAQEDAKVAYDQLLKNKGEFKYSGTHDTPAWRMANSMVEDIPPPAAKELQFADGTPERMKELSLRGLSRGEEAARKRFGWIDNAPEGTKLYGFDRDMPTPLRHYAQLDTLSKVTLDALRSGQLTPQQVQSGSHSVENAVRMADVLRKERVKAANFPDVFMDLPDLEQKIVRLNRPGQFAAESDSMGHSVRGYEPHGVSGGMDFYGHGGHEGIKSGQAEVYSIRDKSGKPGATIEIRKDPNTGNRTITQIKGKFNRIVDPKFQPAIRKFLDEGNFSPGSSMDRSGFYAVGPAHRRKWMSEQEMSDILSRRGEDGSPVLDDVGNDVMDAWQRHIVEKM